MDTCSQLMSPLSIQTVHRKSLTSRHTDMTAKEILSELEEMGRESTKKMLMKNHGAIGKKRKTVKC